jgi:ankyrin repeat protein
MNRLTRAAACAAAVLASSMSAAHETDQYTLPLREFADLGGELNAQAYDAIDRAVHDLNTRIDRALAANDTRALQSAQSPDTVARTVAGRFPNAYALIEGWELAVRSADLKRRHPGRVVGYRLQFGNIYQHLHFPLDPRQVFRIWHASTIKAFGVHFGTDKIGHFSDMGIRYYSAYASALRKNAPAETAVARAVRVGTNGLLFAETGMVGFLSAGAYSNADLAANYAGFLFYRNLTESVMLKGEARPPMLVLREQRWAIQPHVTRDSGFLRWFISEHFDETLNPSLFESAMRDGVRKAVRDRCERVLERHHDELDNRRPCAWFREKAGELRTYYGQDYGHSGKPQELITIADACCGPFSGGEGEGEGDLLRDPRGFDALHAAAASGDAQQVRSLLARGSTVDARVDGDDRKNADRGSTALHLAAAAGAIEVIAALVEAGANPNAASDRGVTPLHAAAGRPEAVALLLARSADVDRRDAAGRTPLHWAAARNDEASIRALLVAGAAPDAADGQGAAPLHAASAANAAQAIRALLAGAARADQRDRLGAAPLHHAARHDHVEATLVLAESGAAVDAADHFGITPLHEAAAGGRLHAATALLESGAAVDPVDGCGTTPLHLAARRGDIRMMRLLLARGADPAQPGRAGATALHEAAFSGEAAIIRALLEAGADPSTRDGLGRTPADVARLNRHADVARLLVPVRPGTPPVREPSPAATLPPSTSHDPPKHGNQRRRDRRARRTGRVQPHGVVRRLAVGAHALHRGAGQRGPAVHASPAR